MPVIAYVQRRFSPASLEIVEQANAILSEYANRGLVVTLRQLYYQFVARALIANEQKQYKRLGAIISDARTAGIIDWDHLQDRTRNLIALSQWNDPAEMIETAAKQYHRDLWRGQEYCVEVWIEKDALVGVIETICEQWDVAYFSCRGYTSQSEMWKAAQRLLERIDAGQKVRILHLGDHDPSGIDMSRAGPSTRTTYPLSVNLDAVRDVSGVKRLPTGGAFPESRVNRSESRIPGECEAPNARICAAEAVFGDCAHANLSHCAGVLQSK